MCLRPGPPPPAPDDTAHVARLTFPRGNPLLTLRDRLGPVFDDHRFAPLFPSKGQPAEAPWRLALLTLLQFAEGCRIGRQRRRFGAGSTGSTFSACHWP